MSNALDLNQLHAFVSVAKHRSITIAADHLHLTQPAVTKRLQQLEQQLDIKLFDRVQKRLILTHAGKLLLPKAQNILDYSQDMFRYASTLDGTIEGTLTIATSHHIGLRRLPPYLKDFHLAFPNVDIQIAFMDSEVAIETLLSGETELAFITLPTAPIRNLNTQLLWNDPLHIVSSCDHPLAKQADDECLSIETLLTYPAILPDKNTHTYELVIDALNKTINSHQKINNLLKINRVNNAMETIKTLTGIGFGWSALPTTMIDKSVTILPVNLPIERQLGVAWHNNRTHSNAAKVLQDKIITATEDQRLQ